MPKPGPKPKPTELKKLAGNPGKRPLPNEPEPKGGLPPMPSGRMPREAQVAWLRIKTALEPVGILTEADAQTFEFMCLHYAFAVESANLLVKQGLTIIDKDGIRRKNPAHQLFRDHSLNFRMYAEGFGLSPAARARIDLGDGEEDDLTAELFKYVDSDGELQEKSGVALVDVVGANSARALQGAGFTSVATVRFDAEK